MKTDLPYQTPASTVEERLLRKIPSEETVDRYSPQDNFSIANLFRNKGLTENPIHVDERHSRNLDLGKL